MRTDGELLAFLRDWLSSGRAKNPRARQGYYRFGQRDFLSALGEALGISQVEASSRMDAFCAEAGGYPYDYGGTEQIPSGRTPVVRDWYVPVSAIDVDSETD